MGQIIDFLHTDGIILVSKISWKGLCVNWYSYPIPISCVMTAEPVKSLCRIPITGENFSTSYGMMVSCHNRWSYYFYMHKDRSKFFSNYVFIQLGIFEI